MTKWHRHSCLCWGCWSSLTPAVSTLCLVRCDTGKHVQFHAPRSLPASPQCGRTPWGQCEGRGPQSGLWRYLAAQRHYRKSHCSRRALPLPRLHRLDCFRVSPHRIASGQGSLRTFRDYSRIASCFAWRAPPRILPRGSVSPRCAAQSARENSEVAVHIQRLIWAKVSGSFRFTTHPCSGVMYSAMSSLCAQTTLRAPLSCGAFSNSP